MSRVEKNHFAIDHHHVVNIPFSKVERRMKGQGNSISV
jgi:hypothetical protein